MTSTRPYFRNLQIAFIGVAVLFALVMGSIIFFLDPDYYAVHPSERLIVEHIYNLGGDYGKSGMSDSLIAKAYLASTDTTDEDLKVILQLRHLRYLDLRNTKVTDESLDSIFHHGNLREARLKGSKVTSAALTVIKQTSGNDLSTDL